MTYFVPDPTLLITPQKDLRENPCSSYRLHPTGRADCWNRLYANSESPFREGPRCRYAGVPEFRLHPERRQKKSGQSGVPWPVQSNGRAKFYPPPEDRQSIESVL